MGLCPARDVDRGLGCSMPEGHAFSHSFDRGDRTEPDTPERVAETARCHAKDKAVAELEAATLHLNDINKQMEAAKQRYNKALEAFTRAVVPQAK